VYAGVLGAAQGLALLLDAAALAGPEVVDVVIAGDGPDGPLLRRRVERERLDHVRLLGPVAAEAVPDLYADADIGLVPLRDRPIFSGALPTKMYEVMAAGRAVVLSARGEAATLVNGSGAGVVVPPESPRALADTLIGLQGDPAAVAAMGERARATAGDYGRDAAVTRWASLIDRLAAHR
jgi:glycosyltransferase involved in cell wall biosynthesis